MPTDDEYALIERFGLFFEASGGTRTAGRMSGWLLICDPPQQSISELAEVLQASKASVSTVARQMQSAGYLERVPRPGTRQHYYQFKSGGMTALIHSRTRFLYEALELGTDGLALVGRDTPRGRRLREWEDFMRFYAAHMEELVARWERHRRGEET